MEIGMQIKYIIANVPHNLWERDIIEHMGTVLTTDDYALFDNIIEGGNGGLQPCLWHTPSI